MLHVELFSSLRPAEATVVQTHIYIYVVTPQIGQIPVFVPETVALKYIDEPFSSLRPKVDLDLAHVPAGRII